MMITTSRRSATWFLFACLFLASAPLDLAEDRRGPLNATVERVMKPEDLFRLVTLAREYGPRAWSPDQTQLAFVMERPKGTTHHFEMEGLLGLNRSDIWIVNKRSGMPRRITDGLADDAGYFAPVWSPRGDRIALLSTKGDNIYLWLWEKDMGKLRRLTDRGVSLRYYSGWFSPNPAPMIWISNDELICPVLPLGEKPEAMRIINAPQHLLEAWPRAWKGEQSTVSVLETGSGAKATNRQGQLLRINVVSGQQAVIAEHTSRGILMSPNGRYVAFQTESRPLHPVATYSIASRQEELGFGLSVADRDSNFAFQPIPQIDDVIGFSWSPDSGALAVLAREAESDDQPSSVFVVCPQDGSTKRVTPDWLEVTLIDWSSGYLLAMGLRKQQAHRSNALNRISGSTGYVPDIRQDWWLLDVAHEPRNLTAHFKNAPERIMVGGKLGALLCVSDGALQVLNPETLQSEQYPATSGKQVQSIVWPLPGRDAMAIRLVLGIKEDGQTQFYGLDLTTGKLSTIRKPREEALLLDYEPKDEVVLFHADTDDGTYLWLTDPKSNQSRTILKENQFLREITPGKVRQITYRGLDGKELKGWVLLPPVYVEGRRYPLVVNVYAFVWGDKIPDDFRLASSWFFNLQLLAARGYTVLFPSASFEDVHKLSAYYLGSYGGLTNGVLPAVDKTIDLGIADPDRIGVLGYSFGAYSVYGLITQTQRFKSAVALAGWSDVISFSGEFNPRRRYEPFVQDTLFAGGFLETAPWEDLDRYVQNSPLFHVDRVATPLMIIQGDLDGIPITQGEEFFTALHRLKRRATFVRYWGEGHALNSPANVRDMWHRVFAWFDEFLDISRDELGNLLWDGNKVKSRNGMEPSKRTTLRTLTK